MSTTLEDAVSIQNLKYNFTHADIVSLSLTSVDMSIIMKEVLAACNIVRLYRTLSLERWMNKVICSAIRKHSFANRIQIYNSPISSLKPGGILNLHRHLKKTKHVILWSTLCSCGKGNITYARYYSVGMKARCSSPYLEFFCEECKYEEDDEGYYFAEYYQFHDGYYQFHDGEYYQFPQITKMPNISWDSETALSYI